MTREKSKVQKKIPDRISVNLDMASKGAASRRAKVHTAAIIRRAVCSVIIFLNGKKTRKNRSSVMKKRLPVETNIGI